MAGRGQAKVPGLDDVKLSVGNQVRSFALVGAVGFIIDGGIMSLLHSVFAIDLVPARIASFIAAVSTTWWLNRLRTFGDRQDARKVREWSRYTVVNSLGAAINMGIFFWLIDRFALLSDLPLLPLAIASAVALVFNFTASKHIAFRVAGA